VATTHDSALGATCPCFSCAVRHLTVYKYDDDAFYIARDERDALWVEAVIFIARERNAEEQLKQQQLARSTSFLGIQVGGVDGEAIRRGERDDDGGRGSRSVGAKRGRSRASPGVSRNSGGVRADGGDSSPVERP